MDIVEMMITIVCSVLASSGFWAYIMKKNDTTDNKSKMLMGLAHDRIMELGQMYLERGYITPEEYENLHDYLFTPYKGLNGNGSAAKMMIAVDDLPICPSNYNWDKQNEH